MGFFDKLKKGLQKTRDNFVEKIDNLVSIRKKIDEEFYEEMEEILISADIGAEVTLELVEELRRRVREQKIGDALEVKELLKEILAEKMSGEQQQGITLAPEPPTVILVVGVNGVGKTTSIAKMAHLFSLQGKKVLLAAGDTFRAAGIEQLEIWAERAQVEIIKHRAGSDPAAVIYDAVTAAAARGRDVVICDTAGRLHTKVNLMDELKKIYRVAGKAVAGAPHEVLLVLDATTGQNALSQARLFGEATRLSGIILTKLDGTAKGGIVLAIRQSLDIPVKYIGVGETLEDFQEFDPRDFVAALFDEKGEK